MLMKITDTYEKRTIISCYCIQNHIIVLTQLTVSFVPKSKFHNVHSLEDNKPEVYEISSERAVTATRNGQTQPCSCHKSPHNPKISYSTHDFRKYRGSRLEVFLRKVVLKIRRKFRGNLLHIFGTPFSKNTSGWLLLNIDRIKTRFIQ